MRSNPICACGQVKYRVSGISWCNHCDEPPRHSIVSCLNCRTYHHAMDHKVAAEYKAEADAKG